MTALTDEIRRWQGEMIGAFGFEPQECPYHIAATGPFWRLRAYGGPKTGPALLIVSAPIKRPYIWDLSPSTSAVRYCLDWGLRVYLLEWIEDRAKGGLADYAGRAIGDAVAAVARDSDVTKPILIGHSLGGTFAAIYAALEPETIRGLVLLAAPLCFEPGTSEFRDHIVALAPASLGETEVVPGSVLSQISTLASPKIFVWDRIMDGAVSLADPRMAEIHARVERWTFDEFSLPGRLVQDVLQALYRENRFCKGTLALDNRTLAPACVSVPTLAVVSRADGLAPEDSVRPFIEAMPAGNGRIILHDGESGVGLQHVAILAGPQIFARVWPQIMAWVEAQR